MQKKLILIISAVLFINLFISDSNKAFAATARQTNAYNIDHDFNDSTCTTFNAKITVTNLPANKTVWVGCDGDRGSSSVGNAGVTNVCSKYPTKGHYDNASQYSNASDWYTDWPFVLGADGAHHIWCYGDMVKANTTGGTTIVNHCSCPDGAGYADGCLKLYITNSTTSPNRACSTSNDPKVKFVLTNYNDNTTTMADSYFEKTCRSSITVGGSSFNYSEFLNHSIPGGTTRRTPAICQQNGNVSSPTVNITCDAPAPTCTLSSSPATISLGGSSTLTWTTTNSTTFNINQGVGAATPVAGGTKTVNPIVSTTYTGTATNSTGSTITCSTSVGVNSPPPPTCTLSVSPNPIDVGDSSTLTWTTLNATGLTINQGIGSVTLPGGSRSVNPAATTVYTGTVTGAGGTSNCSATLTTNVVHNAPVCTLSASPTTITAGDNSNLISNCTITNGDGITYSWPAPTAGSVSGGSASTTTYISPSSVASPTIATANVYACNATVPSLCTIASVNLTINPRLYSISGAVFQDANKNNKHDSGETYPSDPSYPTPQIRFEGPISTNTTAPAGSFNSGQVFPTGNYMVYYDNIPSNRGFYPQWPTGAPPAYSVQVGTTCVVNNLYTGESNPCTAGGDISGLYFGVTDSLPWVQTVGGDILKGGLVNHVPLAATFDVPYGGCEGTSTSTGGTCAFTSVFGNGGTPGVIYTGNTDADLSPSNRASLRGWIAGGNSFPENYVSTGSPLATSYVKINALIDKFNKRSKVKDLTDSATLNSVCGIGGLADCNLNFSNEGIYSVPAGLTLNDHTGTGFTLNGDKDIILLIKGDLNINEKIHIANGSTMVVTVSGNINVNKNIGQATASTYCTVPQTAGGISTGCDIEGYFSTDKSFNLNGINNCNTGVDLRFNIGGSLVVNASNTGGTFNLARDICAGASNYPTISLTERPDFILNSPDFFKIQRRIWQELAP